MFRPEIEVLSAADGVRRRHWREADKLRIVEESFLGHRQAGATARRHVISRSRLTTWRRQYRNGEVGAYAPPFMRLALAAYTQDAASRLHGDDTTVPLLAKGGTRTARLWTYVRDDRPFAGGAPPAALFYFSRDREMAHPNRHLEGWQGILQADAYGGYNDLYRGDSNPGPVSSALCWSHARRKFFQLADIKEKARKRKPVQDISPVALEAVKRIDAIFDVEREINGLDAGSRLEVRQLRSRPLVDDLHDWMHAELGTMSKHNPVAEAITYMFKKDRWEAFIRFLDDGRICLTNNAAERALRGVALGRKSWLFAGSERGGERAAFMYSMIVTAKMNDIDPQAWLADVLARLPDTTASQEPKLLPLNWKAAEHGQVA